MQFADLGFQKNAIAETIVSTYNINGEPNAAPMGATLENDQTLSLEIFNSSQTCRNLKTKKCGVANITGNIELFYKTAFKETNPNSKLPKAWFKKSPVVNAPAMRGADATAAFSVTKTESISPEKTRFLCKVEDITAAKKIPQVYCRAMSATLEAIIHATRVKLFANDKARTEQVTELLKLIAVCDSVVKRTASNSQYSAVMADLMGRINVWRRMP